MAWKVNEVMEQRFELIQRWKEGLESVSELAGRFSVSRKTVYKWIGRYEEEGAGGLQERSRAPLVQARRTPGELEEWIVDLRLAHPTWGPRKLRHWLLRRQPEQPWPAESTMGLILARHELNGRRIKRRHATPSWQPLAHAARANDVWAIDFKGWFYCGAERCDPLTVSDAASRYLLCCRAMAGLDSDAVKQELTPVFRRYGLPARLRSDNGSPFASTGVGGLTPLNVWWVRLGIIPERIEPGETPTEWPPRTPASDAEGRDGESARLQCGPPAAALRRLQNPLQRRASARGAPRRDAGRSLSAFGAGVSRTAAGARLSGRDGVAARRSGWQNSLEASTLPCGPRARPSGGGLGSGGRRRVARLVRAVAVRLAR